MRLKHFLLCASAGMLLFVPSARGSVNLKQVQVSRGDQVDLLFDRDLKPSDLKTEYFRDIIQVSVKNASVYPAKIVAVKGDSISKVFAYQYTPNLIRCRLTVKGEAENYKDTVKVSVSGRMVTLKVVAAKEAAMSGSAKTKASRIKEPAAELTEERRAKLLNKVINATAEEPIKTTSAAPTRASLGGKTSDPSPIRAFWWLAVMLGLVGAMAFGFKKLKGGQAGGISAKLGLSGKFKAFAAKKDFEVISSHHLGPRRSIMLVRVKDRLLVLGVSNESINLITEFNEGGGSAEAEQVVQNLVGNPSAPAPAQTQKRPSLSARIAAQMAVEAKSGDPKAAAMAADMASAMGAGAEPAGPAVFAEFLHHEESRVASGTAAKPVSVNRFEVTREAAAPGNGVRESIRKRVEGYKSL